jgi:lipopolysaccharide transport system ATP-binding protein
MMDDRTDDDVLVKVENVSKKFCRNLRKSLWYGVCDIASELMPLGHRRWAGEGDAADDRPLRADEFWAVRDVSFELRRGECLGLIGHNGAGKTTLLKMLNGLIKPDSGRITMRGRVGALIALGAGFNPILTGRENVYVNGSVLGLSKAEIDEKIDEIIDFAEIREFIDTPVQNYSSGMQVRLGFAVATATYPDVLILDEILAVGDASFRQKCYRRVRQAMTKSSVIIVSHSMEHIVQSCSKAVLMQSGKGRVYDDTSRAVAAYNSLTPITDNEGAAKDFFMRIEEPITSAELVLSNSRVHYGEDLEFNLCISTLDEIADPIYVFTAVNKTGQMVMALHTGRSLEKIPLRKGSQSLRFRISPLLLHEGEYGWHFNLARRGEIEHLVWFNNAGKFSVHSDLRPVSDIPYLPNPTELSITYVDN